MEERINQCIEKNADEMVRSLQEIVGIRSVLGPAEEGAPYGRESRRALQYAMDLAKELGFDRVVNVDDRVCYAECGEGEKVVGVFAHLDIVPEGENWDHEPFGGEVFNGCVYGRGTVDNKGPYISALYALKALKDCGLPLNCRIRVVGGTNEETGCTDMAYYVQKCGAPDAGFTPDGIYPMSFTERGINYYHMRKRFEQPSASAVQVLSLQGGDILNMVPDRATAVLRVSGGKAEMQHTLALIQNKEHINGCTLTVQTEGDQISVAARGLCAHSCTPFNGKNAIVALLLLLRELGVDGSVGEFARFFCEKIGSTTDGSLLGMKRADICGKLTFSVSKMELNEAGVQWIVNIRFPYTYKDDVTPDFRAQMEAGGMTFDQIDEHGTYCFPMDHPLITTLRTVYEELTGRDSTPCNEGGTYAKVVPNIVPFGSIFPDRPDYCHRPNENVSIAELILNAKLFGNAMYALSLTQR